MSAEHPFEVSLSWPADPAQSMPPAPKFSRDSLLTAPGKPTVPSGLPASYGGDGTRYDPEELMMMSLAHCHMLTYLAFAEKRNIPVLRYEDHAVGALGRNDAGKTSMREVILRPRVTIARGASTAEAEALHAPAHANCFMANSVNFTVKVEPDTIEAT